MAKQDDYARYTIRVPADVYSRLQNAAGDKSINAEIIQRLTSSFDWPELPAGMRNALEDSADLNGQDIASEILSRLNFSLDYDNEFFDPKMEWVSPKGTLDERITGLESQLRDVVNMLHKLSGTTPDIDRPLDDEKPF